MKYLLLLMLALITSCAPTYKSLPNHVTLASNSIPQVKKALIADWVSKGFVLQGEDDFSITFMKQMDEREAILYRATLGGKLSYSPEWVYKLTFVIQGGGKMTAFYNVFFNVPNAMGGVERRDVTWEKPGKDLNDYLAGLSKGLAFNNRILSGGRLGIQITNRVVQVVAEGSPAKSGGVIVGDEIVSVNDSTLSGDYKHDVLLLTGPPETVAKIKLLRQSDTLTLNLVRQRITAD